MTTGKKNTFSLTVFHDSELLEDKTLSTTEKKTYKITIKNKMMMMMMMMMMMI